MTSWFWQQKKSVLLVLVPALIWTLGVRSRPIILKPRCAQSIEVCDVNRLFAIDRRTVGFEDRRADSYSFLTQKTAAWAGVGVPVLWHLGSVLFRSLSPAAAILGLIEDGVLLAQAVLWNGAILEGVRLIVQRPRPFVYKDPLGLGSNPAHYVSFYSGHTSFVASVTLALFWILLGRGASRRTLALALFFSLSLTVLTGILRVLAGRHFTTDVVVAGLAGYAVATGIARLNRKSKINPKQVT